MHRIAVVMLVAEIVFGAEPVSMAQIRLGGYVEGLSDSDVAVIAKRASAMGRPLWLLVGDVSQVLPETWFVDAYLEPDHTSTSIQRGRVIRLQSEVVDKRAVRWGDRFPVAAYARVPTIPTGSSPPFGLDRPFVVVGVFTDDELVELVRYIRTSPQAGTSVREPNGTGSGGSFALPVNGHWPVTDVSRDGEQVLVRLQNSTRSGQTAAVVRKGQAWAVVHVAGWVA